MNRRELTIGGGILVWALKTSAAAPDLYQCEGCEAALERKASELGPRTRIGSVSTPGPPMRLEGTVFRVDRKTPAPGVVVYAYQTSTEGLYANGSPESADGSKPVPTATTPSIR